MTDTIQDAEKNHWVYKMPLKWRPYLQLARYDRPVGYWLLALPGWIGLAFASLSHGVAITDIKWAILILIGAIAMRGAGCTYNDIVDRDLDAQVQRTAKRPIPAGTVSVKRARIWLFAQCFGGLLVLLTLPRFAQIVALCSIPLVAAYPFMKRITWWPQVWLGLTFNWAVLVAYAIKTGTLSPAVMILYVGLMFWTVGYDTIYACQDIEDDALIGVKSTARRFGKRIKLGVGLSYFISCLFIIKACELSFHTNGVLAEGNYSVPFPAVVWYLIFVFMILPFICHLAWQTFNLKVKDSQKSLQLFKSNMWSGFFLVLSLAFFGSAQ